MIRKSRMMITIVIISVISISIMALYLRPQESYLHQKEKLRKESQRLYQEVLKYGKNLKFNRPPEPLSSLINVHPRLHITQDKVEELRRLIREDKKYTLMWIKEKSLVDDWLSEKPPEMTSTTGRNEWQRKVGDRIPHFAFCYLITGDKIYLRKAKEWLLTAVNYPIWGEHDLSRSFLIYGVSIGYDWLYNDLTVEEREIIKERLAMEARIWFLASLGLGKEYNIPYSWWYKSYLQNHLWIAIASLGTAGFALYGEVPDAEIWINQANSVVKEILNSLGEDGAWHEGVHYWSYGLEWLLKYLDLAKQLLGEDLFDNEWLKNTAYYRLYNMLPRSMWGDRPYLQNCLDFADCNRRDSRGSEHILRKLASEYNNSYAQWLADEIDSSNTGIPDAYWLNLIWYDPRVPSKPPSDLPLMKHFTNLDQVIMRSSWSDDAILFSIKCGPPPGHKALKIFNYDPGLSHVHPDVNHFVLVAYGKWLVVDDGYIEKKLTSNHNTILVNGKGQLGEGEEWFNRNDRKIIMEEKRSCAIIRAESNSLFDYVIGEASKMYPDDVGLKEFLRHVIYLKPDIFIIVDELKTANPSTFEWLLHCEGSLKKIDNTTFLLINHDVSLMIKVVLPSAFKVEIFNTHLSFKYKRGTKYEKISSEDVPTLKISTLHKVNSTIFMVVLHPAKDYKTHPTISFDKDRGRLYLSIKYNDKEIKMLFNFKRMHAYDRLFKLIGLEEPEDTYLFIRKV